MTVNMNYYRVAGTITKDIDLRMTSNGQHVCNFSIAINEFYNNSEHTTFLNIQAWGFDAVNLQKYMGKGSNIIVEGKIKKQPNKDGSTSIVFVGEKFHYVKMKTNLENKAPETTPIQPETTEASQPTDVMNLVYENLPF